ncbi:MAG: hypothetical protein AVDCRST_MAG05-3380, partial [uncultured Rubrobacteraceae bacterium]
DATESPPRRDPGVAGGPPAGHRRRRAGDGRPAAKGLRRSADARVRGGQRVVVRLLPWGGWAALRRILRRDLRLRPSGGRLPRGLRRHPRRPRRGSALDGPGPEEERPRFRAPSGTLPPPLRRARRLPLRDRHRGGPDLLPGGGRRRPLRAPHRQHRDL